MDGMKPQRKKYSIKHDVKLKNRYNGDIVLGDIINEEEIEGKSFYVLRNQKGSVVKLTREAYYVQK
jgi:hypothetical protein